MNADIHRATLSHRDGGISRAPVLRSGCIWTRTLVSAILGCGLCISIAQAQVVPDAGSVLREQERARTPGVPPRTVPAPTVEEPTRPAMKAPDGARFIVKGFRFTRTTAFPEAQLLPLLQDLVGKSLGLADLESAADRITRYYRSRGWMVARAYIPSQDIKDGIVEIIVLEGRLDRVSVVSGEGGRLNAAVVTDIVAAALHAGEVREDGMERALLLINDLPGVQATSSLSPGADVGTSLLTVETVEGRALAGNVDLDNGGSKFSGVWRLGANLNLNDPRGIGDQLFARVTHSSGTEYARLGYQLPWGANGLTAGASYTYSDYRLCCDFAPLQAKGDAKVASLTLAYPVMRSRAANVRLSAGVDAKAFYNQTIAGTTSDKDARVLNLALSADATDAWAGGGYSSGSVSMAAGRFDLGGWSPDLQVDDATARTHGDYQKVNLTALRLQAVGDDWTLFAAFSAQFASRNLDSAEKFSLGGPAGVRAYPQGEAAGDEGLQLNLEMRRQLGHGFELSGFLDHGEIRLHRNEWTGWQGANTRIGNRYGLSGVGVALQYSSNAVQIRATVAQPLGSNPGRDVHDNDSDGSHSHTRAWLTATAYF